MFRRRALAAAREWLLAAPVFSDQVLVDARARFAHRRFDRPTFTGNRVNRSIRPLAPWVDTLDLDVAAGWLYQSTAAGVHNWPPATRNACDRMAEVWKELPYGFSGGDPWVVDVGEVFGLRGLPYPPAQPQPGENGPDALLDRIRHPPCKTYVTVRVCLDHLRRRRRVRRPMGARELPSGHTGVLGLGLLIDTVYACGPGDPEGSVYLSALGSVFRDAEGRVLVLWREALP